MKALIIGSEGQDGVLLSQLLAKNNVEVLGIDKSAKANLSDSDFVTDYMANSKPDQIYYLAACNKSAEQTDADSPGDLNDYYGIQTEAYHNFLFAVRKLKLKTRLFYAASSLVYGNYKAQDLIDENTAFDPICFYGMTKAFGISLGRMYREKYGVFATAGILFNHESEHRKPHFLTKKIIQTAVQIKLGKTDRLILGSLENVVDWSHAEDFVRAFYQMLKSDRASDYVIASGQAHSIRDFVVTAFSALDLDWQKYVEVKTDFIQRQSITKIGNPAKLKAELNWQPKYNFKEMVLDLVNKEIKK
jgi:GDPmannose 4,6-dehydratase